MPQNTLLDAVTNLKKKYNLNKYQGDKIYKYFNILKTGNFIYPGELKSRLVIDNDKSYKILDDLKSQGFLVNIYEVYCKECSKSIGKFLNAIKEFNENIHCDNCDEQLNPLDNLIVLYKVIGI